MATDWGNDDPVVTAPVADGGFGDAVVAPESFGDRDEPVTAVFGGGTKLKPDTKPEYSLSAALRGLKILGRNYAPASVHAMEEVSLPAEPLRDLPRIDAPDIPALGIANPQLLSAPINAGITLAQGLSAPANLPLMLGAGALSTAARLVPEAVTLGKAGSAALQGYFAQDMARGTFQQGKEAIRLAQDPESSTGQVAEAVLGTGANALLTTAATAGAIVEGLPVARRLAGKTPEQASKTLREEIRVEKEKARINEVAEDKAAIDAMTDAADALDREVAFAAEKERVASEAVKAQKEVQRAQEQQAKAVQDAQQPPEVPKSTQILAEGAKPPALANVATEIGTQTSPFAVQGKINELTGTPPPTDIKAVAVPEITAAPIAEMAQIAEVSPAIKPEVAKTDLVKSAVKTKGVDYQYTVFRPGEGLPDAVQVDVISPDRSESLTSSNVADLKKAGAKIPDVPDWVPQGRYTLAELKALLKKGEPKNAVQIESPSKVPVREPSESSAGVRPADTLDQGAAELRAPADEVRQGPLQESLIPPSNMKRADLRAELRNAGITTLKGGVTLEDAAPNQLMAAVGELRKGKPDLSEPAPALPKKGKIAGSKIDKWADKIIKEGRTLANFDPELLAAHSVKLAGQLERGAVDFAAWSKEKIAEAGEAIQPYLQQIWDEAHNQIGAQRVMSGSERGVSKSALGKYDYIKTTNAGQIEAAQPILEYVQRTGDFDGGFERLRSIENTADRGVAAAALIDAAEGIADPMLRDRVVARLFREAKGAGTDAAQGLQAQGTVNEIIEPYRGHLAWMDILQSRRAEAAKDVPAQVAEGAVSGMKQAGKSASEIAGAATRKRSPQAEANSLVNQFAKLQSDTQAWGDKIGRPVKELVSEFLSDKITPEQFLSSLDALKVKRVTSETLLQVAQRQKSARAAWKEIANNERLLESLEKHDALVAPLRRIADSLGIELDTLFTELPESQVARKAEIMNRLNKDSKFSGMTESTKQKVAAAAESAWEQIRNRVFREEFGKLVENPNVKVPIRTKLEKSVPDLIKQANLGLLDNEAFLSALGKQYGIEGIDSATGSKLRELGQKAARTPEGSERNEVYQQIMDTIMEARGVKPWEMLRDYWYRNVMSAPRTAVEIGAGGLVQGAGRTFTTAVDTAVRHGKPGLALRMIGMFLQDATTGARLGADLIATGDRAILPRYTEQFLAKMDKLEKGEAPGGEMESLYRRSKGVQKAALAPFEMTGRILTALDYIGGQGVRSQQMLYSALTRGDKASFDAALKRFNAEESTKAVTQAKEELGANARPAQIIARTREILNEGISKEIQKFGNTMTEVTALNAPPVGLGGEVYKAVSQIPMMLRAPTGLAFAKAAINIFQEATNWAPITGQINVARAAWQNPTKGNPFRFLALDKLPPERARQLVVAQYTGLAVLAAAASKFLSDQPEDKEGKPRAWDISGSWNGLTQAQRSALLSAGERPLSIKLPDGRWVDYKQTPFIASLATIGHWRDQQRFAGKKWNDEEIANKVGNAFFAGLGSVKDLSLASQFSKMAGILATDDRPLDTKGFTRFMADSVGNSAVGLLPMSSLLRELDNYGDSQRYRPGKTNPGVDAWLASVPYVRRYVGEVDGKSHPLLNFIGEPVQVDVNPLNRHIGPGPSNEPVEAALSEKIGLGMKLPVLSDDGTIVGKDAKQRQMTEAESYFYQKAVRQGFARQIANDLPAFQAANAEQAALYSQAVFTAFEKYARDRLNTGAQFDGNIPVDPKLSSALLPEYQQVKDLNSSEATPAALERSKLRIAYEEIAKLPESQRKSAIRQIAAKDGADFAMKLVSYALTPSTRRDSLEKATSTLDADTRAEYYAKELAKLTPEEGRRFVIKQIRAGLLTPSVLTELAKNKR